MPWIAWLTIGAGFCPLTRAWLANRQASLRDAILWAAAAWMSWGFYLSRPANDDLGYLALCMTGGAGVAVLGARRPHVFAWNFVVLGLLGVMTLPLLEGMVIQVHSFNRERQIFLAVVLIVGIGNYLATRFSLAACAVGTACSIVYVQIVGGVRWSESSVPLVLIGMAPWLGWLFVRRECGDAFDDAWLAFRDRYGFVWGSRVREQFNAAAKNAELSIKLHWRGKELLRNDAAENIDEAREILKSLTKRFMG